jgi:hypothetical protein
MSTPSTYTQKGIAAVKAGNLHLARQFLEAATAENPEDVTAWLWMSGVVHTSAEKRECLKRVLAIDPDNAAAKRGLDLLGPEPAPIVVEPIAPEPIAPAPPPAPVTPVAAPSTKPVERKVAAPRPPAAPRPARRGRTVLLIVLLVAVIGVIGLIVVTLTNPGAVSPASAPTGPRSTAEIPATWTPTPTGTPRSTPTPRPAPEQLQPLVEEAIRIRELAPVETIHYVLSAQFDLDLYLRNDLDAQSATLANTFWDEMRALGLVDYAVEYDRQQLIDATSRQLGGFYSPADKTLYAVTESSRIEPSEYAVIVHEYTHALTDMHFDLNRLYRPGEATTDSDLAARALAEGDATLVENSSPWANYRPTDWELYGQDARWAAPLFRQSGVSPALLFIQSFPYVEGWEFVWTLREAGGWERVNAAYGKVPASTEEILHPAKYLAGDDPPFLPGLPDDILVTAFDDDRLVVANDTLGEFVIGLLLEDFIEDGDRARRAAAGWGGDVLRVWADDIGHQAYVLLTIWDTEEDAREFFSAASDMLKARTGDNPATGPDIKAVYFEGESSQAYISLRSDEALIIWSNERDRRDEILEFFPDY